MQIIQAPIYLGTRVYTAAGDITVTNETGVIVNKSSGAATVVNLPKMTGVPLQVSLFVKDGKGDAATNPITVDGAGSETIDGATTFVINRNYGWVMLVWNGTQWNVLTGTNSPVNFRLNGSVTATTDTATITAAQVLTGVLRGVPTGAAAYTLPTAALLVAAIPNAAVGMIFDMVISNKSAGANTITVSAGAGGTAEGTLTVAQNAARNFRFILTNVTASSEAYTVYGM